MKFVKNIELIDKLVIDDYPRSIYHLTGPSVIDFLQGQLTCDIKQASVTGWLAGHCNYQGRLINVCSVTRLADGYLLHTPGDAGQQLVNNLNKFAILSRVNITDISDWHSWIIYSNNSYSLELWLTELNLSNNYYLNRVTDKVLLIYAPTDDEQLTNQLIHLGCHHLNQYWNYPYILTKIPIIYQNTCGKLLPHPSGLVDIPGAVSFNKGCYVGQEIISKTQHRGKVKKHAKLLAIDYSPDKLPGQLIDVVKMGDIYICLVIIEDNISVSTELLI